jgi:hypothetical protein
LNQSDRVVISAIAEKHHAVFVLVGEFETHDVRPEFCAPLDIADAQHHMANLSNFDGSLFFRHRWLLSAHTRRLAATFKVGELLSRKKFEGKVEKWSLAAEFLDQFPAVLS